MSNPSSNPFIQAIYGIFGVGVFVLLCLLVALGIKWAWGGLVG